MDPKRTSATPDNTPPSAQPTGAEPTGAEPTGAEATGIETTGAQTWGAEPFDWRRFLTRWSEEWADAQGDVAELSPDDAAARESRWLGSAPADEADIAAMEARLGREMPPSYREFLRVSDGWRHAGGFVWKLAGTREAHWHEDAMGLGKEFGDLWGRPVNVEVEEEADEDAARGGLWARGLQLDVASDATSVLLDPADVGPDGEWAARVWASWGPVPEGYPSFAAFMVAKYQEFHCLQAGRAEGEGAPAFVNETTRAQDAAVARARTAALRGEHEEAARLLLTAREYGRPHVTEMLYQIGRLGGGPVGREARQPEPAGFPAPPPFLAELFTVCAVDFLNVGGYKDDWHYAGPYHHGAAGRRAADLLRRMREGTYGYRPGGPFGEAVDAARESARWGDTDAAWRILRAALPMWEPLDPDHIAPMGLLGDPVLAPVLTAGRRLELLATPRGGESGPAPSPARDRDPGGLSWVARLGGLRPGQSSCGDCRLVLVEGAAPDELPALLGSSPDAALSPPLRSVDLRHYHRPDQRGFSGYDDKALLRVGRAGAGWSFGFEADLSPAFPAERFVSPAQDASARGGLAVVAWGQDRRDDPVFHLSVARDGDLLYAFTARGGVVEDAQGDLPAELAPAALGFGVRGAAAKRAAAGRALDVIADRYGVGLPRLAVTEGRLHSFESRSWIRPPGPGEAYATLGFA
ncbi:SMI1/KNR4 family protein [Streptomyces varsoviensis]|uniref:SMI1/KNR4 family protein n=1 Tax=Streptomyces varsoviensis TaxID=67373 RepID=UPI00340ADAB8